MSLPHIFYGYIENLGHIQIFAIHFIYSVKKRKPPVCLSGGMTKVQGVRDSLKRKQKDEGYEMQPQPEVAYYQSRELRMSSLHESSFSNFYT